MTCSFKHIIIFLWCFAAWGNVAASSVAGWHAFKYDYDPLSRLTAGKYSGSNMPGSGYGTNAGYFDELYAYDVMGNMTSLYRQHLNTPIDQLSFMHEGNRAMTIADASGNSIGFSGSGTYAYDMAGRMINDSQKGTIAYNHLGLTKSVTKGSDVLKYTYDASGRRIKKQLNNIAPRWYMDGIECSGDTTLIHTEYGRIRRNAATDPWKWDYFLKDHLGNVRVVLEAPASSTPGTQSNTILYMATMEESKAATEDTYFANLDETRADRPYNYPDKNLLNAKLAKVPGKSKGPSILPPVLAGDTVSISAKAFYNMDHTLPSKSVDIVPVVGSAITAMSSPVSGIAGEAARLAVDLGAEASQSVALRPALQDDDSQKEATPQSGINFILYNNRMEVVEENTGVLLVEDKINEIQTLATDNLVMQEAGFLEVYINNEAQTPVYYDNFAVATTTSNVVEINAYYPYGMIIPGLSLMAPPGKWNGYKYSAKELETALNLGVYDFGRRMYDPIAPRFWTPDRFAEKYPWLSPYGYAANNPINNIDVNGDYIVIVFGDNQMRVYEFGTTKEEDEEDEFFRSTVKALNQLGSGKFGGAMISALQNSDLNFNISYGEQSKAEHIYTDFKMEDGVMKTGANMEWNGSDLMGLGHEIGHGWDAMNGYDISWRTEDDEFGIPLRDKKFIRCKGLKFVPYLRG